MNAGEIAGGKFSVSNIAGAKFSVAGGKFSVSDIAGGKFSVREVGSDWSGVKKRKLLEMPAPMSDEDEAVAEVMHWLDDSAAACGGGVYQKSGFVTINGNEESCGPSFSDSDSTVMVYLDTRSLVGVDGSSPAVMMLKDATAEARELRNWWRV